MHLGNIYTALMSYLHARSRGGRWLLRIEDLDPQRSRTEWADRIIDDLQWLGLHWDGDIEYQSRRHHIYQQCLERLSTMGLVYPCRCTRAEIMATQAPHESDGHIVYSGRCRPAEPCYEAASLSETLRLRVPDAPAAETFTDDIHGPQRVVLAEHCGDFVLRRRDGAWAYQLSVSVDDALTGVNTIVRGDDLLLSTALQRYVVRLLRLPLPNTYVHLPLLRNEAGVRLSKRDGAMSMDYLRTHSTPHDIIARLATLAGLNPEQAIALLNQ